MGTRCMRLARIIRCSVCCWVLFSISAPAVVAQVSVLMQHNDNSRTGQNLQETILNTSSVNVANFGLLFSLPVSGNVFAQPLYVSALTIGGASHNVVYVATAQNNVYAFDADSSNSTPLWAANLGTPVPSQDICSTDPVECPYTDVIPVIGILATPVIDPVGETIYVVANTKDTSGDYHFKLHALDLTTGAEKFGGPEEITAPQFTPLTELCRPGLLLVNGTVYMAFGSVGDFPTWHGFVMGYSASTLQQVAVYNSTPQDNSVGGAGIWHTGNGLVADSSGNVYAVTSNGNFDVNTGGKDYGSAYLKLSGGTLSVLDYFVPYNQASMNPEEDNVDLGTGGPLLIPNTTLLVGGGKDAVLRVVDTTNMGKYNSEQNNNHQNLIGATNPPIFGSPVYWDSPNLGPLVYMWGQNDFAKAWGYNAGTTLLSTTPVMEGTLQGTKGWNDQSALSISANGSTTGTGILWASMPYSGISNPGPVPGILYALDATNLGTVLWNSQLDASRDAVGNYAKFVPPTVANGKVYLATFSGELMVYGVIAPPDFAVTAAPSSQTVTAGSSASYIVYVNPQGGFSGTVTVTCSGLPSGASCSPTSVTVPSGSGGEVSVPLTVMTTAGGSSTFTVTATGGSLVHTTTASLTVAGFNLTAAPPAPATITPGASATSTVTVTASGGFNSTVNLTCAITPSAAVPPRCSLSSASVSGGSGTATLTVSTVASTASVQPNRTGSMYYAMLLPLCGLTLLGAKLRPRSRNPLGWLVLGLMLLGLVWLAACGGGSSGGGGNGSGGTTAGTYNVTVTGTAGALTQSQTLSVTVQ